MLFNSFTFCLIFLPVTLIGFFALSAWHARLAAGWLGLASLAFYAWWKPVFVLLLIASVIFNYAVGTAMTGKGARLKRPILVLGLAGNLLCLGYFKYVNFFMDAAAEMLGRSSAPLAVILPLGISFFTFTQIAFLADVYAGKVRERSFLNYLLFVTFFPHLIAGPVLHHAEMMPQFADRRTYRFEPQNFIIGLGFFFIGLVKKIVFADSIAPFVGPVFDGTGPLSAGDAWIGALAYSMQIYFDFSGYSDMAIGLARMMNIGLPLNFASPYRAASIIEFWRRWHMTLSRFLRDYLYIPLGGNRRGEVRRFVNLFVTMLLGGLWHGAGWGFVAWGALHGAYLMVNHGFRAMAPPPRSSIAAMLRARIGWAVTFLAVVVAWVFFRATTLAAALRMLKAMTGTGAADLSMASSVHPDTLLYWLGASPLIWIALLGLIAWTMPNSQTIMGRPERWMADGTRSGRQAPLLTSAVAAALAALCLFTVSINDVRRLVSPFIYFNF